MCFHGNQLSWAIKHPVISLCLKYHSPGFIIFPTMLAPVISSLDEIYCTKISHMIILFIKTSILAILCYYWPVFGLSWPQYQCSKILISVSDIVLTGLSEIGETILNTNDICNENADFDHFRLFLGLFLAYNGPRNSFQSSQ